MKKQSPGHACGREYAQENVTLRTKAETRGCLAGDIVPQRFGFVLDFLDLDLDHITDGDDADKARAVENGHVPHAATGHAVHNVVDRRIAGAGDEIGGHDLEYRAGEGSGRVRTGSMAVTPEAVQTTRDLLALDISPDGQAWAGSAQCRLLRRSNGSWVRMTGDLGVANSSIIAVWAGPRSVRAIGDDGVVIEGRLG